MLVVKTVRIPVHYGITRHKLSVLDSLTARTTYGAWLWAKLFKEHALKGSYKDRRLFYETVQKESALPAALVQCCFDVKPIRGIKGLLRRRVGEYRIAFTINFENAEVIILRAARRDKFY